MLKHTICITKPRENLNVDLTQVNNTEKALFNYFLI